MSVEPAFQAPLLYDTFYGFPSEGISQLAPIPEPLKYALTSQSVCLPGNSTLKVLASKGQVADFHVFINLTHGVPSLWRMVLFMVMA